MSARPDGYPGAFGHKIASVVTTLGPVGYAAGGFEVEAREFGMRHIDFAAAMGSDDGAFFAVARMDAPDEDPTDRSSIFVQVFVIGTGVEVANGVALNGVTFRVLGIGF